MTACDDDSDMAEDAETIAARRRLADALDTLPRLTRTAFMLHSADRLSYEHIAWRCGMTVDEVMVRLADALAGIRCHEQGAVGMMGRIRYRLVPWRTAWMQCRRERQDRGLGLMPRRRP
jgi:DNA-directed RNA polymerase specialized sigma24 family protein